jgi:hypothetical protein
MALGHGPNITPADLVLNYDFSNIRSYSGSGLTINNLAQASFGATLVDGPTYSSGYITLDGTNDYIQLTLPTLAAYTIMFWIYIVSYDGTERQILGTNGDNVGLSLVTGKFHIWNGTLPSTNIGNTSFSTGVWYHVAYTRTGSSTKIYLNSQIDGSFATGNTISSGPATIGKITTLRYLNARFENFIIYENELTAAQIAKNYNATKGRFGL